MELIIPPSGTESAGHILLGRSPDAIGLGRGWSLFGHAFRCVDFIPAGIIHCFGYTCGALHMDLVRQCGR